MYVFIKLAPFLHLHPFLSHIHLFFIIKSIHQKLSQHYFSFILQLIIFFYQEIGLNLFFIFFALLAQDLHPIENLLLVDSSCQLHDC